MARALRILDANANRAREALRVLEEAARFLLDDAARSAQCKALRHDLAAALDPLLADGRALAERDTPGDVGTAISTETERTRSSPRDVVRAAAKRLSEALRAIEEYAKTLGEPGARAAQQIEQIRYRAYDAERSLVLAMGTGRRIQWRLCVLLTESLCTHHDWTAVACRALEGGADCIQLREKTMEGAALLERATALRSLTREHNAALVINDRPDVALLAEADGVHLGQDDLPVTAVRRIVGTDMLVGVSTTDIEQAARALRDGADICGVGPMFPTTTKHKPTLAGPAYLAEYLAHEPALPPHLAIGGISVDTIAALIDVGCRGIAVSGAVCGAVDPTAECARLLAALTEERVS